DTVGDEALPEVVEIDAPRVRGAVGEVLEDQASGMDAVDSAVAVDALTGRGSGPAHVRRAGSPMSAVEPAVRPPGEAVGQVVPALLVPEPVEDQLRRTVRPVVAVAVGNEVEPGR